MPKDYFFSNYRLADFYDDIYSFNDDISFWLKSTANSNKILELASGTGRITIPLLKNGHEVWAIDYSDEMIKSCETRANYCQCHYKTIYISLTMICEAFA